MSYLTKSVMERIEEMESIIKQIIEFEVSVDIKEKEINEETVEEFLKLLEKLEDLTADINERLNHRVAFYHKKLNKMILKNYKR